MGMRHLIRVHGPLNIFRSYVNKAGGHCALTKQQFIDSERDYLLLSREVNYNRSVIDKGCNSSENCAQLCICEGGFILAQYGL